MIVSKPAKPVAERAAPRLGLFRSAFVTQLNPCVVCGEDIPCPPNEWPSRYQRRRTCSQECHHLSTNMNKKLPTLPKTCSVCGVDLHRRANESITFWNRRQTCGKKCGGVLGNPRITEVRKFCIACGKTLVRRPAEAANTFRRRATCGKSCAMVRRGQLHRQEAVLSKSCAACGETFSCRDTESAFAFNNRQSCSSKCRNRLLTGRPVSAGRVRQKSCVTCDVTIKRRSDERYSDWAKRQTCGEQECQAKLVRRIRRARTTPRKFCNVCGKELVRGETEGATSFKIRQTCSHECRYLRVARNIVQGTPDKFRIYPAIFNRALRETIRERDGHFCQLCGATRGEIALPVHHIDYNKHNCAEWNLITLCVSCHAHTNGNRAHWQRLLTGLMIERELLKEDAA